MTKIDGKCFCNGCPEKLYSTCVAAVEEMYIFDTVAQDRLQLLVGGLIFASQRSSC